jgi:hypothetical protein
MLVPSQPPEVHAQPGDAALAAAVRRKRCEQSTISNFYVSTIMVVYANKTMAGAFM